jgi:hypothetical protein
MIKRQSVEALDNSLRDIMDRPELPFGGKTVVFGGDFRQVLPIVRRGSSLASDVIPLGFHAASKTGAQYEGKERPMICRILVACRWRI